MKIYTDMNLSTFQYDFKNIKDIREVLSIEQLFNEASDNNDYCFILINEKNPRLEEVIKSAYLKNVGFYIYSNNKTKENSPSKNILPEEKVKNNKNYYLNFLNSRIKETYLPFFESKNRRNSDLNNLKNKEFNSLSIICHGNGQKLYLNDLQLSINGDSQESFYEFFKSLQLNYLFLNSCYGLKFDLKNQNNLFSELHETNIKNFILYNGLKDNNDSENTWYNILNLYGYRQADIVRIINENMKYRSTDLPRYILFGNPMNSSDKACYFKEYELQNGELIARDENESNFGICKNEEIIQNKYFLNNRKNIMYVIDYKKNIMLFCSNEVLPEVVKVTQDFDLEKIENYKNNLQKSLDIAHSSDKEIKGYIKESENHIRGIVDIYNHRMVNSNSMYKIGEKRNKIIHLLEETALKLMENLHKQSKNSLSPMSEKYIKLYHLETVEKSYERCPYCERDPVVKILKNNIDSSDYRSITICDNCGQIKDIYQNNMNINVMLEIVEQIEDLSLEITFNSDESIFWSYSILGEYKPIAEKVEGGKTKRTVSILKSTCKTINIFKVYVIINGKLNIFTKPFVKENYYESNI